MQTRSRFYPACQSALHYLQNLGIFPAGPALAAKRGGAVGSARSRNFVNRPPPEIIFWATPHEPDALGMIWTLPYMPTG
jgi:hypothetical protein